jgi:zinc transport system permease protein
MNSIYHAIGVVLPFEWLQPVFMKNALLAILLISPIFGMLSTMVVNNRLAFFSDTIGHASLTGVALALLLSFSQPLWIMLLFCILLAIGIALVRNYTSASTDTITGVFFSITVALGLIILSRGGMFNKYSRYLIGDLLSITPSEILMLLILFFGILGLWIFSLNKLLMISVDRSMAGSRGINVVFWDSLFYILIAAVVTLSIQWIGILIINSMLILPGAAGRNLSGNFRRYTLLSILITLVSGITGLILSYYWNTTTGATIVLVAGFIFLVSIFIPLKSK